MHVDDGRTRAAPRNGERDRRGGSPAAREEEAGLGRYRRACRDAEAARLLLAELGRRHGPMT